MSFKPLVKVLAIEEEWISDDKKLRDLYQSSKIAVCFAYNEPFGLIPLEAMACGVPIVAVNEAGYKETVVNEKTGFLVPRNPKIVAKKLDLLLSKPNIALKMGENGRKEVLKKWKWEKSAERIEQVFKEKIYSFKTM